MLNFKEVPTTKTVLVSCQCDVCKKDYIDDDMETQEFFHLNREGGYVSVFGDGAVLSIDICQYCFRDMLANVSVDITDFAI